MRNLYRRISVLDLFVFLSAVLWNLLTTVPLLRLIETAAIFALYVIFVFPLDLARSRYEQSRLFSKTLRLNLLQDAANRLVRMAFRYLDYRIGRSFFSHDASLALTKRRIGSHFSKCCRRVQPKPNVDGWWIASPGDLNALSDSQKQGEKIVTLMFIHGGGFVFACPTFYLEFLYVLRHELAKALRCKVAIFAPFYPLTPGHQLDEASGAISDAWKYLSVHPAVDQTRLMLAGESAGGGLACDLMCAVAKHGKPFAKVRKALLVSPWTQLDIRVKPNSSYAYNGFSDFVQPERLRSFGCMLIGQPLPPSSSPLLSFDKDYFLFPLTLRAHPPSDQKLSKRLRVSSFHLPAQVSMPLDGLMVTYGGAEVLKDQAQELARSRKGVTEYSAPNRLHAWTMQLFYLGRDRAERQSGIRNLVGFLASGSSQSSTRDL